MATGEEAEGQPGIGRVEAFSDGVLAIVITIMVLELHPPVADGLDRLWTLWPVFLAYMLSYAYVAIYWVNHHRLFSHARRVTNALLWSNMLLLFTLSLVPFSTAYLGEHHFSRDATMLYLFTMLLPALAYVWLQTIIRGTGVQGAAANRYHRATTRKGGVAALIYAAGIPLGFITPWLGIAAAALVAALWILPSGPADRLFD
ncbi:TMEM175 family protein [Stakelama sediminis]|uniref:Putative membrane protein n=1 Tax=Stakelama sediminis TaxID=463200 RepID=A0A840YUI3_9SPHN|nr:TMEM175 family protein [Stakelama sediminis]MBB5717252.1 putative membrane protein [Stakelama sediminis]